MDKAKEKELGLKGVEIITLSLYNLDPKRRVSHFSF